MNKGELIDAVAKQSGLSKKDSDSAVNAFIQTVSKSLSKGDSVQLIGFGTFSVTERSARTGRNPRTGKEIQIAARKVAKFKPGKALSETVN